MWAIYLPRVSFISTLMSIVTQTTLPCTNFRARLFHLHPLPLRSHSRCTSFCTPPFSQHGYRFDPHLCSAVSVRPHCTVRGPSESRILLCVMRPRKWALSQQGIDSNNLASDHDWANNAHCPHTNDNPLQHSQTPCLSYWKSGRWSFCAYRSISGVADNTRSPSAITRQTRKWFVFRQCISSFTG